MTTKAFGKSQKPQTRSPIKKAPLHHPGQSLEDHLLNYAMDKVLLWVMLPCMLGAWTVWETYSWWFKIPRIPLVLFGCTLLSAAYAYYRYRKAQVYSKNIALGVKGERAVGQLLEYARANDYQVFHDIPVKDGGRECNIDHVVVGPGGVFAVETKALSKPAKGRTVISFDGDQLLANGRTFDRDPIVQAKASARTVRQILADLSGVDEQVAVRPVVVFPGWFVDEENRPRDDRYLWVLNDEAFIKWLRNEEPVVDYEQIAAYSRRIAEYVRNTDAASKE